jgi:SAM-dependent methyltransferase
MTMAQPLARQMIHRSGSDALQDAIEGELIKRYATGRHVLDAELGSGRGSLPLLRSGMRVTGIVRDQAMLEAARRQADGLPLDLLVGDVATLPPTMPAVDTVLALDVLGRLPNWQAVLAKWSQTLPPGGRIIFDIRSRDHHSAAPGEAATAEPGAWPADASQMAVGGLEMAELASRLGFAVVDMVPYGALLGGTNSNLWWRERLEQRADWRRLLDWAPADRRLSDFILWLEEHVVQRLPTAATGRVMVVLEVSADAAPRNARWRARQVALRDALAGAPGAAQMLEVLDVDARAQAELAGHLQHLRNRVLLYRLLDALSTRWPGRGWLDAAPSQRALFGLWRRYERTDRRALEILRRWPQPPFPVLDESGVPLASGLDYGLFVSLMKNHFNTYPVSDPA